MDPSTRHWRRLLYALLLAFPFAAPGADPPSTPDDSPDWARDDFDPDADEVNAGELRLLAERPAEAVHHHHNDLTLTARSRVDGWVRLRQCHNHLDDVGRAQVLFREARVRKLAVTESRNIGRARVEGNSVQLTDVGRGARLCIEAETRALVADADGSYRLVNGPFMRRFLDGYYPMQVSAEIALAGSGLRFAGITPARQPGFSVELTSDTIRIEAWFEGRLHTEIRLVADQASRIAAGPAGHRDATIGG